MTRPLGRIDVHSHLLPGIDDGCSDVADSVACARELVAAGYTHAFCTPHIWPNLPHNTVANITAWTQQLQAEYDKAGVPLRVLPGGELNIQQPLDESKSEQIVTYAMAGQYCLFDLWADRLPGHFESSVRFLQSLNLTVILAHPERLRAVQQDIGLIDYFNELGLLFQGNLQCFNDSPGAQTRRVADELLTEGQYFLLGSDCHTRGTLDQRLGGLDRAIELVGESAINQLLIENARHLVPGL